MVEQTFGMAKPPEGAISGDTIPRENEQSEQERATVDVLVAQLKTHPAYSQHSEDKLREISKEMLR